MIANKNREVIFDASLSEQQYRLCRGGVMKEQAHWLYRRITASSRQRLLSSLRELGHVPIGILFYHRVAKRPLTPWTIRPEDFVRQLDWLQANYDVVSLEEAQRRIQASFCDRPTVSITFDDGYAENAEFAIPELTRRGLPATYFVATEFVRTGRHFPHDIQAGTPLEPNTIAELRDFAARGIEIGAHTKHHVDLGALHNPDEIREEIVGSVQDLEGWINQPVRYFAFPFGLPQNTSQAAVDVIAETGLKAFCTAYGAWNWPEESGFHLKRIHADPGLETLKNWLTYDSRKLHDTRNLPFDEPVFTKNVGVPASH
jgi:peptidoglycan/xylan/chitin deacetylase (PgdA/CDA1 family)